MVEFLSNILPQNDKGEGGFKKLFKSTQNILTFRSNISLNFWNKNPKVFWAWTLLRHPQQISFIITANNSCAVVSQNFLHVCEIQNIVKIKNNGTFSIEIAPNSIKPSPPVIKIALKLLFNELRDWTVTKQFSLYNCKMINNK